MALKEYGTIPNLLSGLRLLLIPVLWAFAFLKLPFPIGVGLIVAGVTDVLDGVIARKFNMVTALGAKLDSLADDLLLASVLVWVFMLRVEILTDHPFLASTSICAYGVSLLISLFKFRQFGSNLHLHSHKMAAITGYLFFVHAFLFGGYHRTLFYVAAATFILSQLETIAILLIRSTLSEHLGSIFLLRARPHSSAPRVNS